MRQGRIVRPWLRFSIAVDRENMRCYFESENMVILIFTQQITR